MPAGEVTIPWAFIGVLVIIGGAFLGALWAIVRWLVVHYLKAIDDRQRSFEETLKGIKESFDEAEARHRDSIASIEGRQHSALTRIGGEVTEIRLRLDHQYVSHNALGAFEEKVEKKLDAVVLRLESAIRQGCPYGHLHPET